MADEERHGDPVLARGLTQPRRRDVLGLGGLAAAGLALAACSGGAPAKPRVVHAQNTVARFWAAQKRHGHVNFANWPLYIDTGRKTLQEFTAATGIAVSYAEVIQEDNYWVNKIAPDPPCGRVDRLRPHGRHQRVLVLPAAHHGRADPAGPEHAAELPPVRGGQVPAPLLRPGEHLQHPVGVRYHRHRLEPEVHPDPGDEHQGAVEPGLQGPGRDDVRHPGPGQLRPAQAGGRTRRRPPPRTGGRRRGR